MKKNEIRMPKLKIAMKSLDSKGNQVDGFDMRDAHSWVRNAYNIMMSNFMSTGCTGTTFGAGDKVLKDIWGNQRSGDGYVRYNQEYGDCGYGDTSFRGEVGSDTNATYRGITPGRGTTAESFEDYNIETRISHGQGENQLEYSKHENTTKSWDAPSLTWSITLQRYFNNNSGASIDVTEVALGGLMIVDSSQERYYRYIMVARDVLDSAVTVLDSGQLIIEYVIESVFPE